MFLYMHFFIFKPNSRRRLFKNQWSNDIYKYLLITLGNDRSSYIYKKSIKINVQLLMAEHRLYFCFTNVYYLLSSSGLGAFKRWEKVTSYSMWDHKSKVIWDFLSRSNCIFLINKVQTSFSHCNSAVHHSAFCQLPKWQKKSAVMSAFSLIQTEV